MIGVAGGRAKSRQLAAALRARPAVLLDGLSPAPRAVADLLIALRRAGAVSVSWPRCTKCGKELRTYQRRGQDWYCAVCGPRLEPCFACGNVRRVATRDRSGQPRCARCPDGDSRDPIAVICALVTTLQSEAEPEVITEAVREVAPRPSHQQRLARALEDNPALLSGAGHLAPVPAVLRLIEVLNEHGVTGVLRPSCPRCHRGVRISKPLDGERVCRSCLAKARVERCVRCGTMRGPATRDEQRRPVCPSCLVADPANLETCVNCGRRRPVNTRSAHGPLCATCPPLPVLVCSICAESAPCGISRLTGAPWCSTCQGRSARCSGCGEIKPVRSGTVDEPRCERCTEPAFRPGCPTCEERPRAGGCPGCRLDRRLRELVAGPDGSIHPALSPLHKALSGDRAARHRTSLAHTHDRLHLLGRRCRRSPTAQPQGTRPPRAEPDPRSPAQRARVHRNAAGERRAHGPARTCHRRPAGQPRRPRRASAAASLRRLAPGAPAASAHQRPGHHLRAAPLCASTGTCCDRAARLAVCRAPDARATCHQGDLERWLSRSEGVNHHHPGNFVRWATKQSLTDLVFPTTRWQGPASAPDDRARWETVRRLLHDDTLDTETVSPASSFSSTRRRPP